MHLPKPDIELFYKLHPALLCYVNQTLNVVKGVLTPQQLKDSGIDNVKKINDALWSHINLIDEFIQANPNSFPQEELDIIASWKHAVRGKFYLMRHLKDYTVFLDPDESNSKAYGVRSLITSLSEMFEGPLPIMVEANLIPFKNAIIYDGVLFPYLISFGGGYRRDLNEAYNQAKARYGIIESLPFNAQQKTESDADTLKRYLKTKASREMFADEIHELMAKTNDLKILFHQEMGRLNASVFKRELRSRGVTSGWFAVYEAMIIAGSSTEEELKKTISAIVPTELRQCVYSFKIG